MKTAVTPTGATLSTIHESLVQLSTTLGRMAVRQENMLVDLKKMNAVVTLAPCASTSSFSMRGRVPEQHATKPSVPLVVSVNTTVAAALHVDEVLSCTTPARCLRVGSSVNVGNNHVVEPFPTSNTKHLPTTASYGAGNCTLQSVGRAGMTTPRSCSTHVLTVSAAGAHAANNDLHSTSFPCFDGLNPGLWRTQCLEYFTRFSIHKCMWVLAASMHMDGKAKEWFEAYRLRQVVGDWPEFIDDVEAHFLGESLFLEPCIDIDDVVFPEPHHMDLEGEVFTTVGGLSMFLEFDIGHDEQVLYKSQAMSAGALQVEGNHAVVMPIRCSTHGLGVDASVQLSHVSLKQLRVHPWALLCSMMS